MDGGVTPRDLMVLEISGLDTRGPARHREDRLPGDPEVEDAGNPRGHTRTCARWTVGGLADGLGRGTQGSSDTVNQGIGPKESREAGKTRRPWNSRIKGTPRAARGQVEADHEANGSVWPMDGDEDGGLDPRVQ